MVFPVTLEKEGSISRENKRLIPGENEKKRSTENSENRTRRLQRERKGATCMDSRLDERVRKKETTDRGKVGCRRKDKPRTIVEMNP